MKPFSKCCAPALTTACAGVLAMSTQAQTVTVLSDFPAGFQFASTSLNWAPIQPRLILPSSSSGYEVAAQGYGYGIYDFPSSINASGATEYQLTFTINAPTDVNWMGVNLELLDGGPTATTYLNYGAYGAGTYTASGSLGALNTSSITAFELSFDPAQYSSSATYDITFNQLAVLTPVPEPAAFALLALGTAGLLAWGPGRIGRA